MISLNVIILLNTTMLLVSAAVTSVQSTITMKEVRKDVR